MKLAITLLLMLTACGSSQDKPDDLQAPLRLSELQYKRDIYLQRWSGWIDGCDSLLFTSLSAYGGAEIDITEARDDDGRWYRTPSHDCYPDRSASTISKDMLLGLLFWAYHAGRSDVIEELMARHRLGYVMGKGPLSRTLMTPSLQALYAQALVALGGKMYEPEYWYPQVYTEVQDFQAHLQVVGIILLYRITGKIDYEALNMISYHHSRDPRNPLFSFAHGLFIDGDLNLATNQLLDDPVWPSDRLPTSQDRCEEWVIQRDQGKDWEPCDEDETYTGGDLIFLTKLIEDEVN